MQDLRDGIGSRSIWAIGKLKRVQSNRGGGANVVQMWLKCGSNMIILLQFYSLNTGYLLSFLSVKKYYFYL